MAGGQGQGWENRLEQLQIMSGDASGSCGLPPSSSECETDEEKCQVLGCWLSSRSSVKTCPLPVLPVLLGNFFPPNTFQLFGEVGGC